MDRADLSLYHASPREQQRTSSLLQLVPERGRVALDVGARDGHYSRLLAERFEQVLALDLVRPQVDHPRVLSLVGDATRIPLPEASVDFVFCAEVLEHIPSRLLGAACAELERVSAGPILIGTPYRQDIRVGRSTCGACGGKNPPWGHVNRFDEQRLLALFPGCRAEQIDWVGCTHEQTNALAVQLMDWAGNPYGCYTQDEPCIHCGHPLQAPPPRTLPQRLLTRLSVWAQALSAPLNRPHANWVHVLLTKQ